jgi:ADP-ribose pyrophosphatase YjhB (NUDIX family)
LDELNTINEREITYLSAAYGIPVRRKVEIGADDYLLSTRRSRSKSIRGEVVLIIDRPNNCVLLHRKGWYERGVYRLPTGGIKSDEDVEHTLYRELEEETGFHDAAGRFLGILNCCITFRSDSTQFVSYLFYLSKLKGSLQIPNSKEDISDFRDIPISELPAVAENLRGVPPPRTSWGEWRAFAHDFAYELLSDNQTGS